MKRNTSTQCNNGEKLVNDLLSGKIEDFEVYIIDILYTAQNAITAYNKASRAISEYVETLESEEVKTIVVDKIFNTKNFKKMIIFRVARDLAPKYSEYEGNKTKRRSYLSQHPDVKESEFDIALRMSGYSTLSKKYSGVKFTPSEYGSKCQNF